MRITVRVFLGLTLGAVSFVDSSSFAQQAAVQSTDSTRKILNRVNPRYPDLARRMQIYGTVKIEATIAPNGKVKSTKVIGGSPVLTQAALDAIEAWKWSAATGESKQLIELTFQPD